MNSYFREIHSRDDCRNAPAHMGTPVGCKTYTYAPSTVVYKAALRVGEIRKFCKLQDEGQSLMRAAMCQLNLSARAYHRILKLARMIADLAEALQYCPKLMMVQCKLTYYVSASFIRSSNVLHQQMIELLQYSIAILPYTTSMTFI
jgi:magnesium chelatase subunit ChlI-like protein